MAKMLPKKIATQVKTQVHAKADSFGYSTRSRTDNNQFLDTLVNDPEIGGVLREYMEKAKVRTYIKDGILNAYAKQLTKNALNEVSPTEAIWQTYNVPSSVIQQCSGKNDRVSVSRSENGGIFVVSGGAVTNWGTALQKALEIIAKEPTLTIDGKYPSICLRLVANNKGLTVADKQHIRTALSVIGVQAVFCEK
jgi:hypothetical protein